MLSRCVPQPPNVLNSMVANQYNVTAVSNDVEGCAITPGGSEVEFSRPSITQQVQARKVA